MLGDAGMVARPDCECACLVKQRTTPPRAAGAGGPSRPGPGLEALRAQGDAPRLCMREHAICSSPKRNLTVGRSPGTEGGGSAAIAGIEARAEIAAAARTEATAKTEAAAGPAAAAGNAAAAEAAAAVAAAAAAANAAVSTHGAGARAVITAAAAAAATAGIAAAAVIGTAEGIAGAGQCVTYHSRLSDICGAYGSLHCTVLSTS